MLNFLATLGLLGIASLSWWIFGAAGAVALAVALLTVSIQLESNGKESG
ncbi:MAG: hypothetical protein WCE64_08555 [Bacteroidales bacterium]